MSKQEEPVITDFDAVPGIKEFTVQPGLGLVEDIFPYADTRPTKKSNHSSKEKHIVPYGFTRKDTVFVPDPYEQTIIQKIIELKENEDLSFGEIVKRLTELRYKPRSSRWHRESIRRIYRRAKKTAFALTPNSSLDQPTASLEQFIPELYSLTGIDLSAYSPFVGRLSFSIALPNGLFTDISSEPVLIAELMRLSHTDTKGEDYTLLTYIKDNSGGEAKLEEQTFRLRTCTPSKKSKIAKVEQLLAEAMQLIQELKEE